MTYEDNIPQHDTPKQVSAQDLGTEKQPPVPSGPDNPQAEQPAKAARRRPGAPLRNTNSMRHGMRGQRFPRAARADENAVLAILRSIKREFEAKHGRSMGCFEDAVLHRIRRAATKDRLAGRWLRETQLSIEQRLGLVDAMAAAAETIEKCLAKLGLDQNSPSVRRTGIPSIYRQPAPGAEGETC